MCLYCKRGKRLINDHRLEGKKGEIFLKAQSGGQGLEEDEHHNGRDRICFLTCMRAVVHSTCNLIVAVKYSVINIQGWACPNSLSFISHHLCTQACIQDSHRQHPYQKYRFPHLIFFLALLALHH